MSLHNLNSYKESKQLVSDLKEILAVLVFCEKKLIKHEKYVPVRYILGIIKEQKTLLSIHYKNNKKIVETKGMKNE